jgi:hypothetical protein
MLAVAINPTLATELPQPSRRGGRRLAPRGGQPRIAGAVAAGGSVVYDDEAPSFTVLADPDGNRVCVCTYLERE